MWWLITKIALGAFALLLAAKIVPGVIITGWYPAVITAIVLGILNAIIRPVLIILTLPITLLTLGLFIFVINASLFYFASSFVDGFAVTSFMSALFGSVFVSIITTIGNKFLNSKY